MDVLTLHMVDPRPLVPARCSGLPQNDLHLVVTQVNPVLQQDPDPTLQREVRKVTLISQRSTLHSSLHRPRCSTLAPIPRLPLPEVVVEEAVEDLPLEEVEEEARLDQTSFLRQVV